MTEQSVLLSKDLEAAAREMWALFAVCQLKTWRILRKLPCCPWRAGHLAKTIHVLQAREVVGRKEH